MMAKEKLPPPPPDDIPAWFMTYSDVITLLMTFFILLLTFSTTEPERFEKVQTSVHSTGGASGLLGRKVDGLTKDSWVERIRPPAARIASRGSEMPPKTRAPVRKTFGKGVKSLDDSERVKDLASKHHFDLKISELFADRKELSPAAKNVCSLVSHQLEALPVQLTIVYTDPEAAGYVVQLMSHLIDIEKCRPGQIGMSLARNTDFGTETLRFLITRYDPTKGNGG